MTKKLPNRDVAVNPGRSGPPRLTASDRRALATVKDENLRRVLGEILLSSRSTDGNFKELEQWFPVQPQDSVAPAYEGGGVTGVPFTEVYWCEINSEGNRFSNGVSASKTSTGLWAIEFPKGAGLPFDHVSGTLVSGISGTLKGAEIIVDAINDVYLVHTFRGDTGEPFDTNFRFFAANFGEPGNTIVGPEGPAGPTHKTLWNGEGAPKAELGEVEDFYIDTTATTIYGPKTEAGWGEPTSLIGPAGEDGAAGEPGAPGAAGPAGEAGPAGVGQVAKCAGNPGSATGTKNLNATECEGTNVGKIGAEGKLDGVTVAVGDFIMVFTGSIRDGLWEVVRAGGAAEKWLLKRPSGLNTSQQVERSRISVKEGTAFGHHTYVCDSTAITLGTTELKFRQVANRDYGLVTVLPTTPTPIAGDRCQFQVAESGGVVWDLIYTGEGEKPWSKVGGPPLFAQYTAAEHLTTNSAVAQTTNAPKVTAPLAMDFRAIFGANTTVATNAQARMDLYVNGVASSRFTSSGIGAGEGSIVISPDGGKVSSTAAKGQAIEARYWSGISGVNAEFYSPYIEVDPVRVG